MPDLTDYLEKGEQMLKTAGCERCWSEEAYGIFHKSEDEKYANIYCKLCWKDAEVDGELENVVFAYTLEHGDKTEFYTDVKNSF